MHALSILASSLLYVFTEVYHILKRFSGLLILHVQSNIFDVESNDCSNIEASTCLTVPLKHIMLCITIYTSS